MQKLARLFHRLAFTKAALPLVISSIAACTAGIPATRSDDSPTSRWESAHFQQHRLVGTTWSTLDARPIDLNTLVGDHLNTSDFIILGEKHNNPDHHLLHASILRELVEARPITLALEHLDERDASALTELPSLPLKKWEKKLKWNSRGWDTWSSMLPLFEVVAQQEVFLIPARLSKDLLDSILGGRFIGPRADTIRTLLSEVKFSSEQNNQLMADLEHSHCGYLPKSALPKVAAMQKAWDSTMAAAAYDARSRLKDPVVLVVGNEHARSDRGVPRYLRHLAKDSKVSSVAFLEVDPDLLTFEDVKKAHGGSLPYDYVFFTPAADISDPCAQFLNAYLPQSERISDSSAQI